MKNRKIIIILSIVVLSILAVACSPKNEETVKASEPVVTESKEIQKEEVQVNENKEEAKETEADSSASKENPNNQSKGKMYMNLLAKTTWQGTRVYDSQGNDLTKENAGFIGLAKYDAEKGFYEFFDKETGETRGDEGTYFVTEDGSKRILISSTKNYQAIVDITELSDRIFTYKRMGKDAEDKDVAIFVEHVPYNEKELKFTNGRADLTAKTGEIDSSKDGNQILGGTLWNGTVVKDAQGNDVTEANKMFISLAKFDPNTSKYEFFNLETGESRGDFGYFHVLNNNKIRSHVSIGENKYGAVLELTEINDNKFTYKRMGKDAEGNDIEIFVEHEPYKGELKPEFTF